MLKEPCFFTIGEVAERLRVSRRTITRMLADKQLHAVKVRGAVRIPVEAIIKLKGPMQKEASNA